MILEQDGIADVTYDLGTNLFTITTQCGYEDTFQSKPLVNKLNIYYDISCVQCEPPIYYFSNWFLVDIYSIKFIKISSN
jgi:hypothetical protein